MESSVEVPGKTNDTAAMWFSLPTSLYLFKENKNTNLEGLLKPYVHCSCIYNRQEIWNQPTCASVDDEIKKMLYMYTQLNIIQTLKEGKNPGICDLGDIILSIISQSERNKYCMILFTCRLLIQDGGLSTYLLFFSEDSLKLEGKKDC